VLIFRGERGDKIFKLIKKLETTFFTIIWKLSGSGNYEGVFGLN
jgi:hypothetical protein